jgi:hypothetical protein
MQFMMDSSTGYIKLQWTNNGEVIPVDLLDAVEPFVDVPSNLIQNHRIRNPEEQLHCFQLHNMTADNHYQRLRKNIWHN